MTKQKLKKILIIYFKESTVDALIRGTRYPSMTKAIQLYLEHKIPLVAWINIKKWLEEEAQKEQGQNRTS